MTVFNENSWPLWSLMISLPAFGVLYHLYRVRMERKVFSSGVAIAALILNVRVDEGDCVVRYSFADPATGKEFIRSGVIGFLLKDIPKEGETISVRYLSANPRWSRMVDEIHLASR